MSRNLMVKKTFDFTTVKAEGRILREPSPRPVENPLFSQDRLIEDMRFLLNKIFHAEEKILTGSVFYARNNCYQVKTGNEEDPFHVELQLLSAGDIYVIETGLEYPERE